MNKQNQIPTPQHRKNTEPLFELGIISGSTRVDPDDESFAWHFYNHVLGHFGWINDVAILSNWDRINYREGTVFSVFHTEERNNLIITTCFFPGTESFYEVTHTHACFLEEMTDESQLHYSQFIDRNEFFINVIAPAIH